MDILSVTAPVVSPLSKTLAILSNATVRRSAVEREDLKPYWKSEIGHISLGDNKPIIYKSFKDFTNYRKKTNKTIVFSITFPQHS